MNRHFFLNSKKISDFPLSKKSFCLAAGAVAILTSHPVMGQSSTDQRASTLEEIVVTARRREESLQDVPVTVNVLTSDMLEQVNIIRLEDISQLVAGLELQDRSVGPLASMRGVRFDSFISGNNNSVEFYLNDAPSIATVTMLSMFDVGQVEVLRGPQGTLRGRASPSGSIILTTRRPDLHDFGGDIDLSTTNQGMQSMRGALNIPIVEDMLGVRIAGFMDENRMNHVRSERTGQRAKQETDGWRISLRFEPLDNLSINAYHQEISQDRKTFPLHESAYLRDSSIPPSPTLIRAKDRRSRALLPGLGSDDFDRTGLEIVWGLGPVQVNYAGSWTKSSSNSIGTGDSVGFFTDDFPDSLKYSGQWRSSPADSENHELRFSGNLTEKLSYVVGGLYQDFKAGTTLTQHTPIFLGSIGPNNLLQIIQTPVDSPNESTEKSIFGNITYQLTDKTELSAGLRHIDYEVDQGVWQGGVGTGNFLGGIDDDWNTTIYNVSLSHSITSDLMIYVTAGSSWRPGLAAFGNSNTVRTQQELDFLFLPPEESDSIEFGVKSTWLDQRLRINGTVFYQKFDNFPYRGNTVAYVNTDGAGFEQVLWPSEGGFAYSAPLDLTTYGLEIDSSFQITDNWHISGTYSWAQGTQKGLVACNDYFPRDGRPDTTTGNPPITVDMIREATGGENFSVCSISTRSYDTPTWSLAFRTEYSRPLVDWLEGYVRLQGNIYGAAKGKPFNPRDEVSSHAIFSIYSGVRAPDGKWEVMGYVKNLMDTQKVTSWAPNELLTTQRVVPTGNVSIPSGYRDASVSPPREAGLNVRYRF